MLALEGLVIDNVINVFSLSLVFALVGLSVYLSAQVLNITDLTCDASVALGGCSYGVLVLCGVNPGIAFLVAMCMGAIAGFTTAYFMITLKIESVLASIITLTALQTFITKLSFFGQVIPKKGERMFLFTFSAIDNIVVVLVIVLILCILFSKILNSEYGLAMRVYGDGQIISKSLGINTNRVLWIGLGIGNAFAAVAGALIAQISGVFNSSLGSGSFVFGLAATIIGGRLISPSSVKLAIAGCILGSLVYKFAIEILTFSGAETLGSEYNGLIIAGALVFFMAGLRDIKKRRIV
jgi:putative ABC transport system permease protein